MSYLPNNREFRDPTVFDVRDFAVQRIDINKKIINNRIPLEEKPDFIHHVQISGYTEIFDASTPTATQFKCDYTNDYLTFNPIKEGTVIPTISYWGLGNILVSADKIYVHNDNPNAVDTLQDIIDEGNTAIINLGQINTAIDNANIATENANTAATNTNNVATSFNSAETSRVEAENSRVNTESSRVTTENTRVSHEATRVTDETNRETNETTRQSQESARVTAEGTRGTNETSRISAESDRVTSETARGANETTRQTQESARQVAISKLEAKGDYSAGTQYYKNNMVKYSDGCGYVCILDSLGNAPTNLIYWKKIVEKGTDGAGGDVFLNSEQTLTNKTMSGVNNIFSNISPDSIVQDANNRFVNDSEKITWNEKIDSSSLTKSNVGLSNVDNYTTATQSEAESATSNTTFMTPLRTKQQIESATINTISPTLGANTVIHSGSSPVYPKIALTGMDEINILGKDGDCENVSKFAGVSATLALDSTNKQFGVNSVQVTGTSSVFAVQTTSIYPVDATKYYMVSGYIKNVSVLTSINLLALKGSTGAQIGAGSTSSVDTTKFIRVAKLLQPSDLTGETGIYADFYATSTSTGHKFNIDGMQITQITSADYSSGVSACLAKYPYVESYATLQNPMFENRRDNIVINGNGELGSGYYQKTHSDVFIDWDATEQAFKISSSGANLYNRFIYQTFKVKQNTNYTVSCRAKNGNIKLYGFDVFDSTQTVSLGSNTVVSHSDYLTLDQLIFNSGVYNDIVVRFYPFSTTLAPYSYVKEISLIEGTAAPSAYKPCDLKRFVVEGQFTKYDTLTIENGQIGGLLWWKHKTLYGKDYDWQYLNDMTGFKVIKLPAYTMGNIKTGGNDGTASCCVKYDSKVIKNDWTSTIADTFFLWGSDDTSRSTTICVTDTDTGWGETSPVPNADEVKAFMNGWKATANDGTRYTAWVSVVDGTTVPTAQTINFVKANIATNYDGYRLHYKLTNPEPITDANVHVHGDIWAIEKGDNYIAVDSGIVLGEVANPVVYGAMTRINNSYFGTGNSSFLKNKAQEIYRIYKNNVQDISWGIYNTGSDSYFNGLACADNANVNVDTNATYTLDYTILNTLHAKSFNTLMLSYASGLIETVNGHSSILEQKQDKNSALTDTIDKAIYEDKISYFSMWRVGNTTNGYIDVYFSFISAKRNIPKVTIKTYSFFINGNIDSTFILDSLVIKTDMSVLTFKTTNTTTISNLKTYGITSSVRAVFECSN